MASGMFGRLNDRFGRAYSYCGLGNARRMNEDYKNALSFFRKAEDLYKKIGDRVSYSYTLWSVGTTYTMLEQKTKAMENFRNAAHFFRQTSDPRGMIYCLLGTGQIDYMDGRTGRAKESFLKGESMADSYGFKLERRYAHTLLKGINKGTGIPSNLP
jgi:tetratricopeptide (TPR) repeat protein